MRRCEKLALTRKLTAIMREVWAMQPRFEQRGGQRPYRLVESPRFRMAYDFLALRAASGEVSAELEAWWRAFQARGRRDAPGDAAARHRPAQEAPPAPPAPGRRGRSSAAGVIEAYVGIGSNQGNARAHVVSAFDELARLPDTYVAARSALYRSAPVDAPGQPDYVNAVAALDTELSAAQLLDALQGIEQRHGRERPYPNAPRTLDLDLLIYGDTVLTSPMLTLPHPRMHSAPSCCGRCSSSIRASRCPDAAAPPTCWRPARTSASERLD